MIAFLLCFKNRDDQSALHTNKASRIPGSMGFYWSNHRAVSSTRSSIRISCSNALQAVCSALVSAVTPKILSPILMQRWLYGLPLPSVKSFVKSILNASIPSSGCSIVPRLWTFCSMGNHILTIMTPIRSWTCSGLQSSFLPLSVYQKDGVSPCSTLTEQASLLLTALLAK